ncbi:hypothetical protein EBB07_29280 [Paenibacillaceae bacterium]|nr:hypothetical protein EBB07_29280 [Paenibacillaceae bacterium]
MTNTYEFNTIDLVSDYAAEAISKYGNNIFSLTDSDKQNAKMVFFDSIKDLNVDAALIKKAEIEFPNSIIITWLKELISVFADISPLQEERKVTIVKLSEFGFPVAFQTVIKKVVVKPYAQYSESLRILHRPKRKRSNYENIILPDESILVYDGWINVDIDSTKNITESKHFIIKQSKYRCFDKRYMIDLFNSIDATPIYKK